MQCARRTRASSAPAPASAASPASPASPPLRPVYVLGLVEGALLAAADGGRAASASSAAKAGQKGTKAKSSGTLASGQAGPIFEPEPDFRPSSAPYTDPDPADPMKDQR